MFNNSTKLMTILPRKNSMQFISVGLRVVLRFLVSIKNLWQYKNEKKKENFAKHFLLCKIF